MMIRIAKTLAAIAVFYLMLNGWMWITATDIWSMNHWQASAAIIFMIICSFGWPFALVFIFYIWFS